MTAERLKIGQPRFLTLVEILDAHEIAIARHGGASGVRDQGSLESALAMPEQSFGGDFAHTFPFEMAAAYAFHIAKNHPFVDGNKRTAFTAATLFLWMNGWRLEATEADAEQVVLDLVTNKIDKGGFAAWLNAHCVARPSMELRDFLANLDYDRLHAHFEGMSGQSHQERIATMNEAASAIPSIDRANLAAMKWSQEGREDYAEILRSQSRMLTALFRLAEDMGYEW